jgi:hypothetical protein
MKTPYLVQRATINRPLVEGHLSAAVALDYMGSAEFEWGALPKSLQALEVVATSIQVTTEPRISGDNGESLRVLHAFSPDEYEEYVGHLLALRAGQGRTKESTWFDVGHPARFKTLRCDLWWDIENHAMWTFDKVFSKRLVGVLQASWHVMNSQER